MENKMEIVLKAYAEAYPTSLVLNFKNTSQKYFPSQTHVSTKINSQFVQNQGKEKEIRQILGRDVVGQKNVLAFLPMGPEGTKGSWGYFIPDDVDEEYVTTEDNKMTINFKAIQGIEDTDYKKTIFHRVLTMMYAQVDPDDADNYFFDPFNHIENAANLTDTVNIMIKNKVAPAA